MLTIVSVVILAAGTILLLNPHTSKGTKQIGVGIAVLSLLVYVIGNFVF